MQDALTQHCSVGGITTAISSTSREIRLKVDNVRKVEIARDTLEKFVVTQAFSLAYSS